MTLGAAVGVSQQAYPGPDVSAGAHGEDDALRAEFIPDFTQLTLYKVEGFVPGNLLPPAFPTFSHPLQGTGQPVGMIDILCHGQTPGTETPLVPGVIRVALNLDQPAILDVCQHSVRFSGFIALTPPHFMLMSTITRQKLYVIAS
jgi:hypothetical protein